jgi:predicted AlkP superfamily pyrophosphatase or phosphodiesterase
MCCKTIVGRAGLLLTMAVLLVPLSWAQNQALAHSAARKTPEKPKLVVLLVVDQMRGDYVDKFRGQWTAGLKRLVDEGAWFRDAAYPYAATETCVGHSTISTGALPATHGMVANGWWDRETQKMVTCTVTRGPARKAGILLGAWLCPRLRRS